MRVKTIVKAKKSWSMFHRDVAKSVVQFAIEEYALRDFGTLKLKLIGEHETEDGSMVHWEKGDGDTAFIVWISPQTTVAKLAEYILHEMTHVKQAVYDNFVLDFESAIWKGVERPYNGETDYWTAPWEVEARNMGKKLRKKYMKRGIAV